jgi:KUP system potassium uptake protein
VNKTKKGSPFKRNAALTLGAMGVVYGDIGTSPIYAFNEAVHAGGDTRAEVLGVLSLVFWTLTIVVSIKYLIFVLNADNKGEGGTLAMFSQFSEKIRSGRRGLMGFTVFIFLMAAALEFADGILTPAISVTSAVEGIKTIDPSLSYLVVPITVLILAILFIVQFKGTHTIGAIFGPVMILWFLVIGVLGITQVAQNPESLVSLNPIYALNFIQAHGLQTLVVMSSVILSVTGAEALFSDLGHFGKGPIRIGWFGLAGLALPLNYFGQGALLLRDPSTHGNTFFGMAGPGIPTLLLLLITTMATIIASQALISAVASLASQAVQMGFLPRIRIQHTNRQERGQIYVPFVNAAVGVGAIALVIVFETSSALAGAYSLSIAGTMMVSTIGLIILAVSKWKQYKYFLLPIFIIFLVLDVSLFVASSTKFLTGAWIPVLIGFCLASMMWIWRKGRFELNAQLNKDSMSWNQVAKLRSKKSVVVVDGLGIYPTAVPGVVPKALEEQIRVMGTMPKEIVVVNVLPEEVPYSHKSPEFEQLNEFVSLVTVFCGFMEQRNIPRALRSKHLAEKFDEKSGIYFVTDRTLMLADKTSLNRAEEVIFAALHRNATTPRYFYHLPERRVITFDISVQM